MEKKSASVSEVFKAQAGKNPYKLLVSFAKTRKESGWERLNTRQ